MVSRDSEIIASLRLYGAHWRETLREMLFADCEVNAVSKVVSRLWRANLITQHRAADRRHYYRLSGEPPLGPAALVSALAIVTYCSETGHLKLGKSQLRQHYHFMPGKDGAVYCLADNGLCHLRVDLGGDADVIVRKLVNRHRGMYHIDGYRFLVQTGRYSARILTATEDKAVDIQRCLAASPPPFHVEAVVIADMFPLLTRRAR